ncbi:MAG: NAD(P)-binding domain-containing protein [Alphaproteobacteria bacterium]|nr:NAD(P)-binding domain-containing protein [Alphaproteobacteria bacterium]
MGLGMVEIVVILGGLAIGAVLVITVLGVLFGMVRESGARRDLDHTITTGALPPSLHPRIDPARCMGSGTCVEACPETDVLAVLDGRAHVINPTSCIGHGECLRACPVDAITLVLGTEKRGVDIPMVDKVFQTNVPGMYVVGELGGMGLIYNAMTQALQCMDALVREVPAASDGVHQVVVVGAGPAGMAASLAAKKAGLDYVTLDQESVGGTVLQYPRHKLVMTKPVELPLYGRVRVGEIRKEELLDIWNDILDKTGLQVRTGVKVERIRRGDDGIFTVELPGGETLRTHRVVLAMGRRGTPRKLGVPGEELGKVVYRLLEPERYAGSRVMVVGGGDSALEAAVSLAEAGADVTLSYRGDDFSRAKKKNREKIEAKIAAGKVTFAKQTNVTSITPDLVHLDTLDGPDAVANDYVLVFAGGVLPTKFLADAGVHVESYTGQAYAPAN